MDLQKLQPIAKAVASALAGLGTIVALFITLSADGSISASDIGSLIVATIGAFSGTVAVYRVKNKPQL